MDSDIGDSPSDKTPSPLDPASCRRRTHGTGGRARPGAGRGLVVVVQRGVRGAARGRGRRRAAVLLAGALAGARRARFLAARCNTATGRVNYLIGTSRRRCSATTCYPCSHRFTCRYKLCSSSKYLQFFKGCPGLTPCSVFEAHHIKFDRTIHCGMLCL